MKLSLNIDGAEQVFKSLEDAAKKYPAAGAAAVYEEAMDVMSASVKLCPVDKGRLRSTAYVEPPRVSANPEARLGYGTDYGIYVHERTELHHEVGQAKFLEVPLQAARRGYTERVGKRLKKHAEAGTGFGIPSKRVKIETSEQRSQRQERNRALAKAARASSKRKG